jgi:hypothetical protein
LYVYMYMYHIADDSVGAQQKTCAYYARSGMSRTGVVHRQFAGL